MAEDEHLQLLLIRFAPRGPTLRTTPLSHEPFPPDTGSKRLRVRQKASHGDLTSEPAARRTELTG